VTASEDRTAKVWDAQQGRLLASLKGHTEPVQSAAFSPDGTRVVTASKDRTAKVWDTHPETRTPAEIAALVRCHAPWQLEAGVLLQTTPDPTACPQRAPQR
jgi:WD40 repeat protein